MDSDNLKLAGGLVSPSYLQLGSQSLAKRRKLIKALLSNRKLPKAGWDVDTIELFIKASSTAVTHPQPRTACVSICPTIDAHGLDCSCRWAL